ncbi:MAG: metallophosphoesterase [Friedmanniella sp.]
MRISRGLALVVALVALVASACAPGKDPDGQPCANLQTSVFGGTDPTNQSSFLTTSPVEAADLTHRGYTYKELLGPSFRAADKPAEGLVEVHRLYRAKNRDFFWSADPREIASEVREHSYVDQGPAFYLAAQPAECLVGVHRYVFRGQHRLVIKDDGERLKKAGWRDEGIKFYAAPSTFSEVADAGSGTGSATGDASTFTVAVMPDTQLEVTRARDTRLRDRSVWLVENQRRLNLSFVVHSGDLVDVDTPRHEQYERAKAGLAPLEAAGIPLTMAIGNRDTATRCSDISTCSDPAARAQLRDTSTYNHYFTRKDFSGIKGQFEKGKVDNEYAMYEAGGVSWMVLTLELWPRPEVVQWANEVVAAHPHANVIVATHAFLTASGDIMKTAGGYGATSPQYLFDNLIKRHENIKIVLSGHTGAAAHRVDKGIHGNTIYSFLQAIHDPKHNPMRLIQVNTAAKTLETWIYSPDTDRISPGSQLSYKGLSLVK